MANPLGDWIILDAEQMWSNKAERFTVYMVGGMIGFNNGANSVTTAAISWERCKQVYNSHMSCIYDGLEVIHACSDLYGNTPGGLSKGIIITRHVVITCKGRRIEMRYIKLQD